MVLVGIVSMAWARAGRHMYFILKCAIARIVCVCVCRVNKFVRYGVLSVTTE